MKTTRWVITIFLLLLMFPRAQGQGPKLVSMQIVAAPNISPFLSDWREDPTMIYLVIDNMGGVEIPRARVNIEVTGMKYDKVVEARSQEFSIPANGSVRLTGNDQLINVKTVVFYGEVEKRVTATNRIDDDQYTVCCDLYELPDETWLNKTCTNFEIRAANAPLLLQPVDGEVITTKYPVFQWIPSRTTNRIDAMYTIMVRPLRPKQTPQQSFDSGTVTVFEKSDLTFPTVMLGSEALELEDGETYVWQVQAFDRSGKPLGENQGKSEYHTFRYMTLESYHRLQMQSDSAAVDSTEIDK